MGKADADGAMPDATVDCFLLSLFRPEWPTAEAFLALTEDEWQALDAKVQAHRLRPLLHYFAQGQSVALHIPEDLRNHWALAHRASAMVALAQRADLIRTARLLSGRQIKAIALKGAFLAWHAYPEAALRPLRDIDLLVGEGAAEEAFACLLEAGYEQVEPFAMTMADTLALAKHMPGLRSPAGTHLELHMRPWQRAKPGGAEAPSSEGLRQDARTYAEADSVAYPSPEDMFAHLVLHGTLSGAPFDCGPLLLADIGFLCQRQPLDWERVWNKAKAEGWLHPAALCLALTDRWHRPGIAVESGCPVTPPADLVGLGARQLLAGADGISSTALLASLSGPGLFKQAVRRLRGRRLGGQRDFSIDGGFLRWFASRAGEHIGHWRKAEIRRRAAEMGQLTRWLVDG